MNNLLSRWLYLDFTLVVVEVVVVVVTVVEVAASSLFFSALVTGLRILHVTFLIGSVGGVLSGAPDELLGRERK